MIMRHAHVHDGADYDCILCKNAKKKMKSVSVTSTSPPLVFENDNQRRQWQQLHFSVSPQRRPFFHFIPVSRIVTDILHIELRIIPVLWKVTVSARCRDAAHLEDICQWVFDTQRIIISKNTAVQNSRGAINTIGTESWPGRTCRRILIIHEDVLREVSNWRTEDAPFQDIHLEIWQEFINWLAELKYGLPIDTPEHWDAHADRLKERAEIFCAKFQRVAGASGFTPYMHCLIAHVPDIVRRFGGMVKGCSQGAEALNQRIQKTTATSNRHEDTLGAQVLCKEVMATMASDLKDIMVKCTNSIAEHEHGGYMPRKERDQYDAMMHKALQACANRRRL